MAYQTRELSEVRDEIRNRGEITDLNFYQDTEANRAINLAYRDYHAFLATVNSDMLQSTTPELVSISSGTATYNLVGNVWRINGIDIKDGSTWHRMGKTTWAHRNHGQASGSDRRNTTYRAMGGRFILSPEPSWSGQVRVWHISAPDALVNDTDELEFPIPGSEDYIVLHVLMQYAGKAGEDATLFAAQMNALKQQINAAGEIDLEQPDVIDDVWGRNYRARRHGYWVEEG